MSGSRMDSPAVHEIVQRGPLAGRARERADGRQFEGQGSLRGRAMAVIPEASESPTPRIRDGRPADRPELGQSGLPRNSKLL